MNWSDCVIVVTGVAPVTGAVTPEIAAIFTWVIWLGKVIVIKPELALLVTEVAPL